jgi:hypothetical protein
MQGDQDAGAVESQATSRVIEGRPEMIGAGNIKIGQAEACGIATNV